MAISIQSSPAKFAYAGNPINFVLSIGTAASAGTIVFDATAGEPTWGSDIKVYVNQEEVVFSYEYSDFQNFYNDISSNYIIHKYFGVAYATDVITLTSHTSENLSLSVVTDAFFAPCTVAVTEGGMTEENILLGVDVWNGTAYIPTNFDKQHRAAPDGTAAFNISGAFVFEDVAIPSTAFTGLNTFEISAKKYRLRYAQLNSSGLQQMFFTNNDLYAVNGAFAKNYLSSDLHHENYLTASPRYIRNADTEPRFLAVLAIGDYTGCVLQVTAHDMDATTHIITKNMPDISEGQILYIPVWYVRLGLDLDANAPFYKYDLQFQFTYDSIQYSTETFTIECNRTVYHNYHTYLYVNSRGGIDTVSFTGDVEEVAMIKALEYQRESGTQLTESKKEQQQIHYAYKQYTGHYDDFKKFGYIEELLMASQVWWYHDSELIEIVIQSDDFEKGPINEVIQNDSFEFVLVNNDVVADVRYAAIKTGTPKPTITTDTQPTVGTIPDPGEA